MTNRLILVLLSIVFIGSFAGMIFGLGLSPTVAGQILLSLVVLLAAGGVAGFVFRYMVRELQQRQRIRNAKIKSERASQRLRGSRAVQDVADLDLVWYLFLPQSIQSESAKITPDKFTDAVAILPVEPGAGMKNIAARATHSLVFQRDSTGQVRTYIGTSILDSAGYMKNIASNIGYTAERIKGHPPVGYGGGYVIATRPAQIDHNVISEEARESIGMVQELSGSRENGFVGSVILTIEGTREYEKKRFQANSNETAVQVGGEANLSAGASTGPKTQTMASSLMRTTFTVTADSRSDETAETMFSIAAKSMKSLPFTLRPHIPDKWHYRRSWIVMAAFWMPMIAIGFTGFLPVPVMALAAIPAIAATIALLMRPDWLVKAPFERQIKRGYVPVPLGTWWSLRWLLWGKVRANFRDAYSNRKMQNEVAWPSCSETVYQYASSLAETLMPPTSSVQNSQIRHHVPRVAMDREYEGYQDSDYLYGITTSEQPVNLSVKSANLSLCGIGAASIGKTNFMHLGYLRAAQMSVSRKDEFLYSPTLFENKGAGAYEVWKYIRRLPKAQLVEMNKPKADVRLALEGPRIGDRDGDGKLVTAEDVARRVDTLVDQLLAAMGIAGAPRARNNMVNAMAIAMLMSPEEIDSIDPGEGGIATAINIQRPNIPALALILLNADARWPHMEKKLAEYSRSVDGTPRERLLADYVSRHIVQLSSRDSDSKMESTVTRLTVLSRCAAFEPKEGQREISIKDIVTNFGPTVLNLGSYREDPNEENSQLIDAADESLTAQLMKLTLHAYWHYVRTHNSGWDDRKQYCPIFADEGSMFATETQGIDGQERNIMAEIADLGRSGGISQQLFSQRRSNMPPSAKEVMDSFQTQFQLGMPGGLDAQQAIDLLGGERNIPFTAASITQLPIGMSIGKVRRDNAQSTNVFTCWSPKVSDVVDAIIPPNDPTRKVNLPELYRAFLAAYRRSEEARTRSIVTAADSVAALDRDDALRPRAVEKSRGPGRYRPTR